MDEDSDRRWKKAVEDFLHAIMSDSFVQDERLKELARNTLLKMDMSKRKPGSNT
jgi:hypothetical protein